MHLPPPLFSHLPPPFSPPLPLYPSPTYLISSPPPLPPLYLLSPLSSSSPPSLPHTMHIHLISLTFVLFDLFSCSLLHNICQNYVYCSPFLVSLPRILCSYSLIKFCGVKYNLNFVDVLYCIGSMYFNSVFGFLYYLWFMPIELCCAPFSYW